MIFFTFDVRLSFFLHLLLYWLLICIIKDESFKGSLVLVTCLYLNHFDVHGIIVYTCIGVNPFANKPWFLRVCFTRLLKTLCKKEKLLVTSNFSFSLSIFYPFMITFCHFHYNLELLSANSFSLEASKICRWERVNSLQLDKVLDLSK